MMRIFLRLLLVDRHAALVTGVSALAIVRLVLHDADALDFLVAVDAGDHDVGAGGLMQIYILPQRLRLALIERLAFDWLVVTELVMSLHFGVAESYRAPERFILALELH